MCSFPSLSQPASRTITGHARLAGNTSGNEDDLSAGKGSLDAAVGGVRLVAGDLLRFTISLRPSCIEIVACRTYGALGVDVTDISGNAGGATDIEERELSDARVELEEEGQRLADSATGTEDGNLGKLYSKSNVSGRASNVSNGGCCWD